MLYNKISAIISKCSKSNMNMKIQKIKKVKVFNKNIKQLIYITYFKSTNSSQALTSSGMVVKSIP
jgi:hypothetical protein